MPLGEGFAPVIEQVYGCCAVSEFVKAPLRVRPMLLVGLPVLGKFCFAARLADVIGVPRFFYAMDAAETISTLAGSDKHWANSEPGQLFRLILLGEVANPVIVLDELDKAPGGGSGNDSSRCRPANALHGVLELETARALRDKSADIVFDASHAIYVATANKLSTIDGALLSRFTLFHIEAPNARAAVSIARSVARSAFEEFRLVDKFDRIAGEVLQQLASLGNPRLQQKALEAAIGQAVCSGRRALALRDLTAFATPTGDTLTQPMRTH